MRVSKSKWVALITVVLFTLSIIAGCGGGGATDDGEDAAKTIRIGVITPLTGDVKTFGESVRDAFLLAMEEAGNKAGDWEVEFFIEDDRNIPTEAVNVADKLITQNKVSAILGSVTSSSTIPASEVAQANGILMISPTSTAAKVTVDNNVRKDFVFRACFIDPLQGTIGAKFALDELEAKTAAVLFDQGNDYTIGLKDYFVETFEAGGGKVLAAEAYTKNDTDFSAVLTRIAQHNPDVLYLPDYYQKASLISKQARDKGLKAVFMGGDGWDSPELDFAAVEGGYHTNHYSADDPREEVQNWVTKFEAKYGKTPDSFATLAYDATRLLLKAIEDADSDDPAAIRDAMAAITDFPAVSGNLSFDADGNPIKEVAILQISEGAQKFVTTIAP